MQCPKCGYEQQDGFPECRNCGVIFAKLQKKDPPAAESRSVPESQKAPFSEESPIEVESEKAPASWWAIAALLLLIAGAFWWLHFPAGLPLPQNAYISDPKGFALSPPPDWILITPQNHEKIMEQYKEIVPKELRRFLSVSGLEVSFIKIPENEAEFTPSFNVVAQTLKHDLPPLTEQEKESAAKIISGEMEKHLDTYRLESSAIVKVDKLAALQLTATAALKLVLKPSSPIMSKPGAFGLRHVVGHSEEVAKEFRLKTIQTFVPGRGKGYILTCTHAESSFAEVEPIFNTIMDSFRVLDHPPRFGPVAMGAFNGGLIGAGAYLLWICLGRLLKKEP